MENAAACTRETWKLISLNGAWLVSPLRIYANNACHCDRRGGGNINDTEPVPSSAQCYSHPL